MPLSRHTTAIRLVLIAYWTMLFIGTHIPQVPRGVAEVSDKLLHYVAFAGLGFLLAADRRGRGPLSIKNYFVMWGLIAVYAAVDELLQIPVRRTADAADWLADAVGAACGLGLFAALSALLPRRVP